MVVRYNFGMFRKFRRQFFFSFFAIFSFSSFLGCSTQTGPRPTVQYAQLSPTPASATATFRPTYTPTPAPLGSIENPIIIGYILSEPTSEQIFAIERLTTYLSDEIGINFQSSTYSDYNFFEQALLLDKVHVAWLDPIEYLLVTEVSQFKPILVVNHLGVTSYGVQYFVHRESNFTSYYDPDKQDSTVTTEVALNQFAGTIPCINQNSPLSGNLVPLGLLKMNGITTLDPIITTSTEASLRAIYIKGICDFTATYALSGDPRTASSLISDIPEIMQDVIIVWQSDGIIPNKNLSTSPLIELQQRGQLIDALTKFSKTIEGLSLLSTIHNIPIEGLNTISDMDYQLLRESLTFQISDLRQLLEDKK